MGDVYERLIDQWSIDEDGDRFDPRDSFVHASTTILEIGCGRGDLAVSYARAHPNDALMAIDVHTRGIANMLAGIERHGLTNLSVPLDDPQVFVSRRGGRSGVRESPG